MKITSMEIPKQAYIYGAIHILSNRLQTVGDKIDPTISSKQWFLLAVVSKFKGTPPNIGEVAEVLGTSRQNVKKMATILEKRGFLKLEKNKCDLRNIQIFLTEKCGDYFKSREQQEIEYIGRIFSDIDNKTLDSLCGGLGKISDNIDKLLEDDINAEIE